MNGERIPAGINQGPEHDVAILISVVGRTDHCKRSALEKVGDRLWSVHQRMGLGKLLSSLCPCSCSFGFVQDTGQFDIFVGKSIGCDLNTGRNLEGEWASDVER